MRNSPLIWTTTVQLQASPVMAPKRLSGTFPPSRAMKISWHCWMQSNTRVPSMKQDMAQHQTKQVQAS